MIRSISFSGVKVFFIFFQLKIHLIEGSQVFTKNSEISLFIAYNVKGLGP